jgi:RNA polymerase sigma-70 factor (sigma-E family)
MMASMAPAPDRPAQHLARPIDRGEELAAAHRVHYRSLVRLASLLVDDVATCEELVQEAFVQVWRRRPTLLDPEALPAYLRSAVLNGARSHGRRTLVARRHLRPAAPRTTPGAEDLAMAGDPDQRVLDALRDLPARQREVLALRYYLDLSEADIAATLGISPGAVKTHAHRGLARLADRLEDLR